MYSFCFSIGGAIGIIFSLANAVAVGLYVVGFTETLTELLMVNTWIINIQFTKCTCTCKIVFVHIYLYASVTIKVKWQILQT